MTMWTQSVWRTMVYETVSNTIKNSWLENLNYKQFWYFKTYGLLVLLVLVFIGMDAYYVPGPVLGARKTRDKISKPPPLG